MWLESPTFVCGICFTPDGRHLIFERADDHGRFHVWMAPRPGEGEPKRLFSDPTSQWASDLSPNGRFLAYVSDSSGRPAVYVRRLDGSDSIRVSREGSTQPAWRLDGKALFLVDERGSLCEVPVVWDAAGDQPRFGEMQRLFDARLEEAADRQYDVSPDGQRFVVNRSGRPARGPTSWQDAVP